MADFTKALIEDSSIENLMEDLFDGGFDRSDEKG
jgi:hypothetical protein